MEVSGDFAGVLRQAMRRKRFGSAFHDVPELGQPPDECELRRMLQALDSLAPARPLHEFRAMTFGCSPQERGDTRGPYCT